MKSLKIAASLFLLTSTSALAADLPSIKSVPVVAPTPIWTGFYAGLNAGGTWANNSQIQTSGRPVYISPDQGTSNSTNSEFSTSAITGLTMRLNGENSPGFIGGGQAGYNWQFEKFYVAGIETDIQGVLGTNSNNNGAFNALNIFGVNNFNQQVLTSIYASRNLSYLGTVRGRFGYLALQNLLVYATAGLAYGGANLQANSYQYITPNGVNSLFSTVTFPEKSFSGTLIGWTAGGGAEWMFINNWSAKVEYLYYDIGSAAANMSQTVRLQGSSPHWTNSNQASSHFNGNIVRAGVNYHFNLASAPVVAKF
jgi:outer membrane immunogenic protein